MPDGSTPTEWDSLQTLRRNDGLGPAVKLAFMWVWHYCGCRPDYVVINAKDLGYELGKSAQAARKWINGMARASLIEIMDRDKKRGQFHVYVFNPNPERRLPRPDPQRCLFDSPETAHLWDAKGSTPPTSAHLSQAKGAHLSAAKGARPGEETPENIGDKGPPPDIGNLSREKGARSLNDTKEEASLDCQSTKEASIGFNVNEGPAPIGLALAEVLNRSVATFEAATEPAEQKIRLKARIASVCGLDPHGRPVADWVAGCGADLVIFHGRPEEDLERIFVDIQAMREARSLRNGPAFFYSKARELADKHSLPFGKQKDPQSPTPNPPTP